MDLTLSKRGDYVVRAALSLADGWLAGTPDRKAREVVEEMGLPVTYTSQIFGLLIRAGLVSARAGRAGGYRLTRRPDSITLLEVVEAGEGPLAPDQCTLRGGPCRWTDVCAVHPAWGRLTAAVRQALSETNLAAVALADQAIAEGTMAIPSDAHRKKRADAGRANRQRGSVSVA